MDINEKIHFFLSNLRYKRFSFIPTIVIHGNYVMRLYAIYARFSNHINREFLTILPLSDY